MKKIFGILLIGSMLCFTSNIKAQDASEGGLLEHVGVGLSASIFSGPGIGAHISVLPILKARVGISWIGFNVPINAEFNGDSYDGSVPESVSGKMNKAGFSFLNAHILADFYPFGGNSVFSITGGFLIGANKVNVDGTATAPFSYKGIQVTPNADQTFKGYVGFNAVKPYIGLGLGKTIPNSRVGFRWDVGGYFPGKPRFISDNVPGGKFYLSDVSGAGKDNEQLYKIVTFPFIPQMTFTLSYRIF